MSYGMGNVSTATANKASQKLAEINRNSDVYEKRINSERTANCVNVLFKNYADICTTRQCQSSLAIKRYNKKKRKIDDDVPEWSLQPILHKADQKGFLQPIEMFKQVNLSMNQALTVGDSADPAHKDASDVQNYLKKLDNIPFIKSTFGLCCTQYQTAKARSISCKGYECTYLIDVDANCWERLSPDGDKVTVCVACYTSKRYGQLVPTRAKHRSTNEQIRVDIPKSEFTRTRVSSNVEDEPTVTCAFCRRTHHKMCVMYDEYNWSLAYAKFCNGFSENFRPRYICKECINTFQGNFVSDELPPGIRFQFHPADLKISFLSNVMEKFLEKSLKDILKSPIGLLVREVSRRKSILEAKPNMRKLYVKHGREFRWEYLQRSIMLFQEQRHSPYPIAVFNMIVYEYPSTKTVCLSYIDSVKLFEPAIVRRDVFQHTILSYMDDARKRGYTKFHFWACPPKPGDEYVFYGRPEEKRSPCAFEGGLIRWYKEMLNKAEEKGIIESYIQVDDKTYTNYLNIPYLLDDFWPSKLESILNTYCKDVHDSMSADRCSNRTTKSRKSANGALVGVQERVATAIRDECRDTLFCVNLKPPTKIYTVDNEPDIFCPYMGVRDNFIIECRESRFDFSNARRARYSTMYMLSRIAKSSNSTSCSVCNKKIKKGLYCYKFPNVVFCGKNCASVHPDKKYLRHFVTPLCEKKINPNPIFSQILEQVMKEATFLTELAYELCSPKSCRGKFLNSSEEIVRQHMSLLHSPLHQQEQTDCRVCAVAYLFIIRHKEFCKGKICHVPSCTQTLLYDNNGIISR